MAPYSATLTRYSNLIRDRFSSFLWQQPLATRPFWKRFLIRSLQISFAVLRDLTQGQISLRAMSLVFTTVVGFVPLLALTFSVLKSFGVHNAMEPALLTLLEPLGERSTEVTGQILGFVDNIQVELIGITSMGVLIYVVLDMMRKIEVSFNYIWAVKQARSWSNRVREYLFAVIVSPLLLFLSIGITSSVNTNFFQRFLTEITYGAMVLEIFAIAAPVLFMSLAFAFAYSFLPNTKVNFSSALIGGLVTTIIWKLMGSLFQGFFVAAAREWIYLAFATVIAVMFMVYILWLVALVGSSIAFYHQYPEKIRAGRVRLKLSIGQQEELSLALAGSIIRNFHSGNEAMTADELANELKLSSVTIEDSLHSLQTIGLLVQTKQEPVRYLPSKSIKDCTLVETWQALRNLRVDELSDNASQNAPDLIRASQFQTRLDEVIARELGSEKFIDNAN
jgi:membrane protein